MKSLLLVLFSFWMVATGSCGVKRSLRDFSSTAHKSSVPIKHPRPGKGTTLESENYLQCALKDHKSFESLSVEAISVLKFFFQKNLALFPLFLFVLSFFTFSTRRKENLGLRLLPGLSSPPLYIKFRRLQYYA